MPDHATCQRIDAGELTRAQESLLLPLWGRAIEASQAAPILFDEKAVELVEQLDYPFEKFAQAGVDSAGFCIRGAIIDQLVGAFLDQCPEATVVELGAGLDTRFDRLDNGSVMWFDIDLPAAMALRQRLFSQTERHRLISASVLEPGWLDAIEPSSSEKLLFVAEGMLYFIEQPELLALLERLAERFPGARIIFDCQSPLFLAYNNWKQPVADARMLWSVKNRKALERWSNRLTVERYIGFGDQPYYRRHYLERLPRVQQLGARWWPPAREMFKICELRLGGKSR